MSEKTCFFIGHHDAPEELVPVLTAAVEDCIAEGVTAFVVGHYGSFDRMAGSAVRAAKARHPGVTLTLLLPYHPAERPVALPPGFDDSFYPNGMEAVPRRAAIVRANQYMVAHCACLIAYAGHPGSNALALVHYAARRSAARIVNLYP